ncbi:porin, partial [Burkholderia cenocepacia]|nr:porin [Burkholderia cenocepacia]
QSTSAASFSPSAPNTGKVFRMKDGGIYSSFWGIRGSEDIGGGYKINFKLQGSFDSSTGKLQLSDTPSDATWLKIATAPGVSLSC